MQGEWAGGGGAASSRVVQGPNVLTTSPAELLSFYPGVNSIEGEQFGARRDAQPCLQFSRTGEHSQVPAEEGKAKATKIESRRRLLSTDERALIDSDPKPY